MAEVQEHNPCTQVYKRVKRLGNTSHLQSEQLG